MPTWIKTFAIMALLGTIGYFAAQSFGPPPCTLDQRASTTGTVKRINYGKSGIFKILINEKGEKCVLERVDHWGL